MSKAMGITDEEIIAAAGAWNGSNMTYVIRNRLCNSPARRRLKTAYILSRLKKLECAGHVQRVASSYVTQICWKPTGKKGIGK